MSWMPGWKKYSSPRPYHAMVHCGRIYARAHYDARAHFWPAQAGVAVKAGVESAVHTLRAWMGRHATAVDRVVVKLDFSNAFNTVSREVVLPSPKCRELRPICGLPSTSAKVRLCWLDAFHQGPLVPKHCSPPPMEVAGYSMILISWVRPSALLPRWNDRPTALVCCSPFRSHRCFARRSSRPAAPPGLWRPYALAAHHEMLPARCPAGGLGQV